MEVRTESLESDSGSRYLSPHPFGSHGYWALFVASNNVAQHPKVFLCQGLSVFRSDAQIGPCNDSSSQKAYVGVGAARRPLAVRCKMMYISSDKPPDLFLQNLALEIALSSGLYIS